MFETCRYLKPGFLKPDSHRIYFESFKFRKVKSHSLTGYKTWDEKEKFHVLSSEKYFHTNSCHVCINPDSVEVYFHFPEVKFRFYLPESWVLPVTTDRTDLESVSSWLYIRNRQKTDESLWWTWERKNTGDELKTRQMASHSTFTSRCLIIHVISFCCN